MWTTPAASAAASICRASARSRAKGFSHITCLPALTASSTIGPCVCGGVATATMSMSGSAKVCAQLVDGRGMPNIAARLAAFSASRPISACTSIPAACNARTCVSTPNPVPTTAAVSVRSVLTRSAFLFDARSPASRAMLRLCRGDAR